MPKIDNFSLNNYAIDGPVKEEPLKLIGSGNITSSSTTIDLLDFNTQVKTGTSYYIYVTGLSFPVVPKHILLRRGTSTGEVEGIYVGDVLNSFGSALTTFGGAYRAVAGNFWVTKDQFRLPVVANTGPYTWEAYA